MECSNYKSLPDTANGYAWSNILFWPCKTLYFQYTTFPHTIKEGGGIWTRENCGAILNFLYKTTSGLQMARIGLMRPAVSFPPSRDRTLSRICVAISHEWINQIIKIVVYHFVGNFKLLDENVKILSWFSLCPELQLSEVTTVSFTLYWTSARR